jgi:hypothetical protein
MLRRSTKITIVIGCLEFYYKITRSLFGLSLTENSRRGMPCIVTHTLKSDLLAMEVNIFAYTTFIG